MLIVNGQKQRQALTAAQRAIELLASGKADSANRSARRAADLDQVGAFVALPEAVLAATQHLPGAVSEESIEALHEAVGFGPLTELVDQLR